MLPESDIPQETIQAYLESDYRVLGSSPTTLRIGVTNPTLASLQATVENTCSGFLTAWNPLSQRCSDARNATKQRALARELDVLGLTYIDALGQHPSNGWPGEASYLILGLSLEAAKVLGTQFGQNAIVWAGADATPQLILLR